MTFGAGARRSSTKRSISKEHTYQQLQLEKMMETGTLKELNVKSGDVVACWNMRHKGANFTVTEYWEKWLAADASVWTVVSRAADTPDDYPKLWKDMSPEEKGALLLAHHEGKVIEYSLFGEGDWQPIASPSFCDRFAYRIRSEPVVETVELSGIEDIVGCWSFRTEKAGLTDTHRITFDMIDGKPDCNSVKMEEI